MLLSAIALCMSPSVCLLGAMSFGFLPKAIPQMEFTAANESEKISNTQDALNLLIQLRIPCSSGFVELAGPFTWKL